MQMSVRIVIVFIKCKTNSAFFPGPVQRGIETLLDFSIYILYDLVSFCEMKIINFALCEICIGIKIITFMN